MSVEPSQSIDVFISYARADKTRANQIASALRKLGLSVWLDTKIESGTTFDNAIEQAAQQASSILVLWTPESSKSEWVRAEALVGKEKNNLVALMLAPCELPIAFRLTQFEPMYSSRLDENDPAFIKTVERIKDLTNRRLEIEVKQRSRGIRRRIFLVSRMVATWLIGTILIVLLSTAAGPKPSLMLPGMIWWDFDWPKGRFIITGTWEAEEDRLSAFDNAAHIDCIWALRECALAEAQLDKHLNGLDAKFEWLPIITWNQNVIVTDQSTQCGHDTMTIDRATQTVTVVELVDRARASGWDFAAVPCDKQQPRITIRLIDGFARGLREDRQMIWTPPWMMPVWGLWTLLVAYWTWNGLRRVRTK